MVMKCLLSLTAIALCLFINILPAQSAANFESKRVSSKKVPASIVKTHQARYGKAKTTWRRNSWSNAKGVRVTVFVGWFWHERKAHRSAYTPQGKGYLTIRYLGGALGLPAVIKKKVMAAHPGLQIVGAQRYDAFTVNMTAYRVDMRKGSTRVVTWVDKGGTPISKENLPDAIEELGS